MPSTRRRRGPRIAVRRRQRPAGIVHLCRRRCDLSPRRDLGDGCFTGARDGRARVPRPCLIDHPCAHVECLVDGSGPFIARHQRSVMLARSRGHERVVDGTARDARPGELGADGGRGLLREECRRGKSCESRAATSVGDRRSGPGSRVRTEYVSRRFGRSPVPASGPYTRDRGSTTLELVLRSRAGLSGATRRNRSDRGRSQGRCQRRTCGR